jgi:hypothetical protein
MFLLVHDLIPVPFSVLDSPSVCVHFIGASPVNEEHKEEDLRKSKKRKDTKTFISLFFLPLSFLLCFLCDLTPSGALKSVVNFVPSPLRVR